jgi:hypothetical protein
VPVELDRRFGAIIHLLETVDEEVADLITEDGLWVFVGDPVENVFDVQG